MDLSVILVNWNTRDALSRCLASLQEATDGLDCEIVVVDNASSDGSVEMVRAAFPRVQLFANSENLNYAAGSNQAIEAATGARLLLLNPDTEVRQPALRLLLQTLDAHPEAAAAAPALIYPDGRLQASVRRFPSPAVLAGELTFLNRILPVLPRYRQLPPQDSISEVEQPMTSALLVRRQAFEAVGLFDPAFPLYFNDVDWCFRCRRAGWKILYQPGARVLHELGASTRQVRAEAILLSHAGLERFYMKHYGEKLHPLLMRLMLMLIRFSGRLRAAIAAGKAE